MVVDHTSAWNQEVLRKILNSVAGKYDCGVRFTVKNGRLHYEGDRDCAMEILKEAISLIGRDEGGTP